MQMWYREENERLCKIYSYRKSADPRVKKYHGRNVLEDGFFNANKEKAGLHFIYGNTKEDCSEAEPCYALSAISALASIDVRDGTLSRFAVGCMSWNKSETFFCKNPFS